MQCVHNIMVMVFQDLHFIAVIKLDSSFREYLPVSRQNCSILIRKLKLLGKGLYLISHLLRWIRTKHCIKKNPIKSEPSWINISNKTMHFSLSLFLKEQLFLLKKNNKINKCKAKRKSLMSNKRTKLNNRGSLGTLAFTWEDRSANMVLKTSTFIFPVKLFPSWGCPPGNASALMCRCVILWRGKTKSWMKNRLQASCSSLHDFLDGWEEGCLSAQGGFTDFYMNLCDD